jgi:Mg2+ and Co2+ transporter CorA
LNLLSAYAKQLDEFEQLENRATRSDEYLSLLDNLSPLVRSIRNFYEVLQEARTSAKEVSELIDLRDKAYELSRQSELLYQDTKNAMDVAVIRRAEEQSTNTARLAQANHRLNRMVAMFLPLTTMAAVFGTQFTQDWNGLNHPVAFAIFVLSGILAGVLLLAFISRK